MDYILAKTYVSAEGKELHRILLETDDMSNIENMKEKLEGLYPDRTFTVFTFKQN